MNTEGKRLTVAVMCLLAALSLTAPAVHAQANAPAGEAAADKAGSTGDDNVCVVDVKTAKVIARHKVGAHPFGGGLRFPTGRTSSR